MRLWWARGHQWLPESCGACLHLSCCGWALWAEMRTVLKQGRLRLSLAAPGWHLLAPLLGSQGSRWSALPAHPSLSLAAHGQGGAWVVSQFWRLALTPTNCRPKISSGATATHLGHDVGGMSTYFRMRSGWTLTVAFTCGTQGGARRWGAAVAVLAVWVGDGVMGAGPDSWVFSGSAWWVSTSKIMLPSPSWWESLFLGTLIRW